MQRIALTLQLAGEAPHARLRVFDTQSQRALVVPHHTFLLTLEREAGSPHVRGRLQALDAYGSTYPIQSNVALFEAIKEWVAGAGAGA